MGKILQQGHMDGFCLLYAMLNGFKALTSPELSANDFSEKYPHVWSQLISVTPSLINFASGKGSNISELKKADNLFEMHLLQFYAVIFSHNCDYEFGVERISRKDLGESISENSVAIIALRSNCVTSKGDFSDHWVCLVDFDGTDFLVACSSSDFEANVKGSAKDYYRGGFKRPFNNKIAPDNLKGRALYHGAMYRLVKKPQATNGTGNGTAGYL